MAAVDLKQFHFGYMCGGTGVDATEVFSDRRQIKMICFSGNADNATCALQTKDLDGTYTAVHALKASDTNELNSASGNLLWFGETGAPFHGLKITPSHASDRLFIHFV